MRKNKLWGCITTSEAIEKLKEYQYFFANADHILVISDEQPDGMVEMTDEYIKLFKSDDWMFLNAVVDTVRREQLEKYPEEAEKLLQEQNEFIMRFRHELEEMRVGTGKDKQE